MAKKTCFKFVDSYQLYYIIPIIRFKSIRKNNGLTLKNYRQSSKQLLFNLNPEKNTKTTYIRIQ